MPESPDRLYELLPVVYRQRDEAVGSPLRDLLRVIGAEAARIDRDIMQMYDDWFIETCQDWVVPYIADLLGYAALPATETGSAEADAKQARILTPRREVANLVAFRRRRGTLSVLERIANDASGLPARAVEFFKHLLWFQSLNHQHPERGRTADLRNGEALDRIGSPFNDIAHSVDVRRPASQHRQGRFNIPAAGAYVWRLKPYGVTHAPAYALQTYDNFYTFSVLGNEAPLFTKARREDDQTAIAGELDVPAPIRRRALDRNVKAYYGLDKSFVIYKDDPVHPVPAGQIIAADLSDAAYRPPRGFVAVDPQLGLISFAHRDAPKKRVWVTYRYGFGADIGGGEYARRLSQPRQAVLYRVGKSEQFTTIASALARWKKDGYANGVIEIGDSEVYTEPLTVDVPAKHDLQIRAANRKRPVLSLLDWDPDAAESLRVRVGQGARFTLDGLLVAGRPLTVEPLEADYVEARVAVRHTTLVPGWVIGRRCNQLRPNAQSIRITDVGGSMSVDASILGRIQIINDVQRGEPLRLTLRDSILDAREGTEGAIDGIGTSYPWTTLTFVRCTVLGTVTTHSIELAENSIFTEPVRVVRRQIGCVRFCYLPRGSRTPRRYHCQPDLSLAAAKERKAPPGEVEEILARVVPRFDSVQYGTPDYCRMAFWCPDEIARGADDRSEMGVFHDTFLAQRAANLRARLDEYTPAGMETGIFPAD
jgi:hypothetical protein